MNDFTKRYTLKFENAFVFKGQVNQMEYSNVIQEMNKIIIDNRKKVDGYLTTCTHSMSEDGKVDVEIIIPLSEMIVLDDEQKEKYQVIESIEIENCLKIRHEGNPQIINEKLDLMKKYIDENNLEQMSDVYSVIIKDVMNIEEIDNAIMEAYVQVN